MGATYETVRVGVSASGDRQSGRRQTRRRKGASADRTFVPRAMALRPTPELRPLVTWRSACRLCAECGHAIATEARCESHATTTCYACPLATPDGFTGGLVPLSRVLPPSALGGKNSFTSLWSPSCPAPRSGRWVPTTPLSLRPDAGRGALTWKSAPGRNRKS